ncbi:murein L,D-transpeptidase family protein [Bacteriovorax sp. DB6_IX]|uniref:L,D-transpeptidase family protein n=1 Tax=Bacteriovorax sp. DB6_IX TaxID=1353530 RepID=UPI00038A15D8|nr:L,D-transpeptidase family protein [Bacteriovorax sp. DB6_IX]EQC52520.1 L,D-transpeptidase catalytic domain protein [Bacteriovorax sp. DB6_IX]
MRSLFLLFTFLLYSTSVLAALDKVVVYKMKRKMHLIENGEIIKSYPVMLGQSYGKKRRQGDNKTPEGRYVIDWHNPNSRFYLSLHINYPNQQDREYAREKGIADPGDNIFIHGVPKKVFNLTDPERIYQFLKLENWTNGCIALSNKDMKEVYDLIPDGTVLEIFP